MRRSGASVLLLLASCAAAPSADKYVHMEPMPPPPRQPRLHNPIAAKPAGVLSAVRFVTSPRRAVLVLPMAACVMALACPDVLARMLVQLVCYIGALIEPLEQFLPEKGALRAFVTTVQQAKKAYNVKHGLVSIDEQQFFDDEDEDPPPSAEAAASDGDEGDAGADGGGGDGGGDDGASGDDAKEEASEEAD